MANHDRRHDEETPLLQAKANIPLPWDQISLALFTLLATEPIASGYIYPFINQVGPQLHLTYNI